MDRNPFIVDFLVNFACVVFCLIIANYFYYKKRLDVNTDTWFGLSIWWLLAYLCAILFHVSWVLVPINGGIPWQKSGALLVLFFASVIATIYFYFKSRKKQPPVLDKPDAP